MFVTLCMLVLAEVFYEHGLVAAMTTSLRTTTMRPQPSVSESFEFKYDSTTNTMVVRAKDKCYMWLVTDQEHQQIHTDAGMRNVEFRVLSEIANAVYTAIPRSLLNPSILNACATQATHFYLVH